MRCIIGQLTGNFLCGNKLRTVLLLVPFTENTVDGRNPAPHWMVETLSIMGCLPPINWWFGFRDRMLSLFAFIISKPDACYDILSRAVMCRIQGCQKTCITLVQREIITPGNVWYIFFDFNLNIFVPVICGRVVCVHFAVDAFNAGIYSDRFDCIGIG